jgi:hypothetical protein
MAMAVFPVLEEGQRTRPIETMKTSLPRGTSDEDGTTSNLAILDHLKDNSGSLSRLFLSNEALRGSSGF